MTKSLTTVSRLRENAAKIATEGRKHDQDHPLLTEELAEWLKVSSAWLEVGRHRGYGPPYFRLSSGLVRYRRRDVIKWLNSLTVVQPRCPLPSGTPYRSGRAVAS